MKHLKNIKDNKDGTFSWTVEDDDLGMEVELVGSKEELDSYRNNDEIDCVQMNKYAYYQKGPSDKAEINWRELFRSTVKCLSEWDKQLNNDFSNIPLDTVLVMLYTEIKNFKALGGHLYRRSKN